MRTQQNTTLTRITRAPAAKIIGVSPESVRYYTLRGELPAVRNASGHWEYDPAVVRAFAVRRAKRLRKKAKSTTPHAEQHSSREG